jgi:hypothetical protein
MFFPGPQQAQVNLSLIFLHIHGGKIKGISNMQKFWQKCGVVEAVDTVLNLPVRLNPVTRDSNEVNDCQKAEFDCICNQVVHNRRLCSHQYGVLL